MLTASFSYQRLDVIIREAFLDSFVYLPLWTKKAVYRTSSCMFSWHNGARILITYFKDNGV